MTILSYILWGLSYFTAYSLYMLYMTHMFQLNSYKNKEHMQWVTHNMTLLALKSIPMLLSLPFLLVAGFAGEEGGFVYILAAVLCNIAAIFIYKPKSAKKPLVYTMRVKRLLATTGVITLLFFIIGVRLMDLAIWYILTPILILLMNLINRPLEILVNNHYVNDAKKILQSMPQLTVIGITGSFGKTSVKYFLSKLLSTQYNVLHTPGNFNTTLGVVRTIRSDLKAFHEIFVCEMGARQVGDIKEICDLVQPKYGIITSIGNQHLQSFLTIDNIIKTKFELADSLPEDGIAFLNYDNMYIRERMLNKTIISYGTQEEGIDQYHAFNITVSHQGTSFQLRDIAGDVYEFHTKLLGGHNVANITGAIAVANQMGIPMEKLIYPVKQLESVEHRLQLINQGSRIVIDDAYNSNPDGFCAALDVLSSFDAVRILLTPGMVELGSKQYESNKEVGKYAAGKCDYAVLVGKEQTWPINEGLREAGFPVEHIIVVANLQQGFAQIDALSSEDKKKVILIENDLPDNY